jgi:5'-nucleotidase
MPVILVTNDDGVASQGIRILSKSLRSIGEVYVVAPEREQSAVGHALTLHRPLKFRRLNKRVYFINGTPTDCVILGVNKLLPQRPDLVVSGINNGGNLGDDITYSGTVAAAIEGTMLGIPSIAVSLVSARYDPEGETVKITPTYKNKGLQESARFIQHLASIVLEKGLPPDTLLNVNIPDVSRVKGVRLTKQGKRVYDNSIQEIIDPRGEIHYWIGSGMPLWHPGEDTDFEAIQKGFISVTPIHLDLTNYDALSYMKNKWRLMDGYYGEKESQK